MKKMKAGFIGFMPFFDPSVDIYALLQSYAQLGYKGFEGGDMLLRGDYVENLKRVKSFGIEPITLGYMKRRMDGSEVKLSEIIENAHKLEVNRITTFSGVAGRFRFSDEIEPPTYDEIMREIEELEEVATECKKEGIEFAFHNHDIEFELCYRGVPALYLMCANSENLRIELDIGWCMYSGKNPAIVIKDLGSRLSSAIHIKDYIPKVVESPRRDGGVNLMPQFVAPGTGVVNLSECLEEALKNGVEWAVLEQDFQYNISQVEALTASYLIMKESGYVE
ncbi:MAG: sugar phosphate isomerase/epimerase [Clostridiales bacterium]|jgi:sugar phosphate isomerase/epimerase|nr:sugar phosphate isomerase/epimerase [Clostridiales bacterium]